MPLLQKCIWYGYNTSYKVSVLLMRLHVSPRSLAHHVGQLRVARSPDFTWKSFGYLDRLEWSIRYYNNLVIAAWLLNPFWTSQSSISLSHNILQIFTPLWMLLLFILPKKFCSVHINMTSTKIALTTSLTLRWDTTKKFRILNRNNIFWTIWPTRLLQDLYQNSSGIILMPLATMTSSCNMHDGRTQYFAFPFPDMKLLL